METEQVKKGRLAWDFQISRYLGSLKTAWAIAIISLALAVLELLFIGSYLQQPKLLPYVVEVQGDQLTFRGVMSTQKLTINDAAVRNYIIRFVTNLRTISSDVVVLKTNLKDVYSIATPPAQRQLTEMIVAAKPFELSSHDVRVDIQFTLFEKTAEHSWRAEWIEQVRQSGNLKDTVMMAGSFTYTQGFPKTDIEAERNPFGLYFTEFFITQRRGQ